VAGVSLSLERENSEQRAKSREASLSRELSRERDREVVGVSRQFWLLSISLALE
jgi:hypothetical protein